MQAESNTAGRWPLAVVAVALIVLLATGLWLYRVEKQAAWERAEKQLAAVAQLKVDQIVNWRHERLGDGALLMANLSFGRLVHRFLTEPEIPDVREELDVFFRALQTHYHYADILLVDPAGVIRMQARQAKHDEFEQFLAEAFGKRRPVFTDLHAETGDIAPHISVVAPLFVGAGQTAAPLAAIVLISDASQFLFPLIQSWPTPSRTAETLLVRRDGEAVLFLNDLRHQRDAALKLRMPTSRTNVPAVMAVQGRVGLVEGVDYRGVASVAFVRPVPGTTWFIVAKDESTVVFAGWRSRLTLLLALLTAMAIGLGAIGLFVWQRGQKRHYQELYRAEAQLRASRERHSITLQAVGDGIIATDAQGRIELLNPVAETLTGWRQEEACGRPLEEIFVIVNETTRHPVENPVIKVLREGRVVGLANHTLLVARDGSERPIADSAAPIRDGEGTLLGVVLVFRDQEDERRAHRIVSTRLALMDYAVFHGMEDLLTKALDDIGALVDSPIGFFHLVDADQTTLTLQQWSTRTLDTFCQARSKGLHYAVEQAGIWADCVRTGRPVVHNDYAALVDKKGLPEGHAHLVRELVVPVLRGGRVVAVLGVGNKPVDYTEKDVETVGYLAEVTWLLIEQKKTVEKLRTSEERFRSLYQSMMDAFVITDMEGCIKECNGSFGAMLGYGEEDLKSMTIQDITPPGWHGFERQIIEKQVLSHGYSVVYEKEYRRRDGTVFPVELRTFLVVGSEGQPKGMSAIVRDISDRKWAEKEREKLQAQLIQAQKMESVGRLAGGVAHDFNNMLSVIIGYAELALGRVDPADPLHRELEAILDAGKRSAAITRQLLAFARRQTIAPRVLDLNETVEGMLKMLRRLIGEDLNLAWLPGADLKPVKIDPSQVDQILANLCVNSRDAITGVGKVTIETGNVHFDAGYCADHPGFVPGSFVRLAVSDDGCGMDQVTLGKLFEPFFTTKKVGEGTGLGLATVWGIVKQNNGFVNVYSEPGQGTTFKIYLPAHEAGPDKETKTGVESGAGQGETVLVVEDEIAILNLARTMLERLGYVVLTAATPGEALRLADEHGTAIHLLITDVVMPEMNGRELAEQLQGRHPEIGTLFMSGYTANVIAHRGILDEGVHFMHKPFSKQELATRVREALNLRHGADSRLGEPS